MPYVLALEPWATQEWKVKIFDIEGPEDPHATVYRHASPRWRVNLRTGLLMDRRPPAKDLPSGLLAAIREHLGELQKEWDQLHPENPISLAELEDE